MIYCIGNRVRYEAKLASGEPLYKAGRGMRKAIYYEGGSVWQTEEDARVFIAKNGIEESHAVYGVLADWETDTLQVPREPYRRLVKRARIAPLCGEGKRDRSGTASDPGDAGMAAPGR